MQSHGTPTLLTTWLRRKCLDGPRVIGHVFFQWFASSCGMIPNCLSIAKTKSLAMTKSIVSFSLAMTMLVGGTLVGGKLLQKFYKADSNGQP